MNDKKSDASSLKEGYRQKPLWIYAVSFVFLISPFINFAYSLKGRGEPGWLSPAVWLEWLPHTPPRSFAVSLILFITGVLILFVNRWSWWLALTSLIILCGYNLLLIRGIVENNFLLLFLVSALMAGFMLLLSQSEFREIFLNQRLRWWESKPRFIVNLEVGIKGKRNRCILLDISKSGLLLSTASKSWEPTKEEAIEVEIAEGVLIPGNVVRIEDAGKGYQIGVRIGKIGRYESRYLYNWIKVLSQSAKKVRE